MNGEINGKNFSYLYKDRKWQLSPAYALTFSRSNYGEHLTSVNGNGKDPQIDDFYAAAEKFKLLSDFYKPVTEMIREYADEDLADIMILE
ncbi:MAG: hypothetical protein IJI14_04595 [Anaerolineaceae bacterium]|nr:hypothetical protein [Anaerolineaceae bacterium]